MQSCSRAAGIIGQVTKSVFNDRISISAGLRFDGNAGRYFQLPAYTTMGYRNSENKLINKATELTCVQADQFDLKIESGTVLPALGIIAEI